MTQRDENPNIEFPTPICPITEPHAKHIIPGTWREQCNGVEMSAEQRDKHSSDYWERTTEGMPRVPAFAPPAAPANSGMVCRTCAEPLMIVEIEPGLSYHYHEGRPRGHHATPVPAAAQAHEEALREHYERTAITPPTPDVSDLMEEARAMVKRAGHPRHSFALGYASRVLALAAAGSPIHPDDARMAYAVYRAAAGPAAPAEARRARPAAITTPPDSLRAEFAEAHRREAERAQCPHGEHDWTSPHVD